MPEPITYSMRVYADPEDGDFVAVSPEFPGVTAFAESRAAVIAELETAISGAIATYREQGWPLPKPLAPELVELPSGAFRLRLPRSLHAALAQRARSEGVSQNTLAISFIAQGLAWMMGVAEKPLVLDGLLATFDSLE